MAANFYLYATVITPLKFDIHGVQGMHKGFVAGPNTRDTIEATRAKMVVGLGKIPGSPSLDGEGALTALSLDGDGDFDGEVIVIPRSLLDQSIVSFKIVEG